MYATLPVSYTSPERKVIDMKRFFSVLLVGLMAVMISLSVYAQNTYSGSNQDFNVTATWGQLEDYTTINGVVENKRNAPVKVAFKPHAYDAAGNELVLPNDAFYGMDYAGPNNLVLPQDKGYFSYAFETAQVSGVIAKITLDVVNPEEYPDKFQFQITDLTTKTEDLDMGTRVAGKFTNMGDPCFLPNIAVVAYKNDDLLLVYQMATSAGGGSATELAANQSDTFNFSAHIGAKSLSTLGATKIEVVGGCSSKEFGTAIPAGKLIASAVAAPAKQPAQEPAKQPAPPAQKPAGKQANVDLSAAELTWDCSGWYSDLCQSDDPAIQQQCLEAVKNEKPFYMVSCEIKNNTAVTVAPSFLVHYLDAAGKDLIEAGHARPGDRVVLPNSTVYMLEMREIANPENIKDIKIEFDEAMSLKEIDTSVETADVKIAYDDFGATVTGTLKNTGNGSCFNPSMQVASYRGTTLVGVEDLYVEGTAELAAGQSVEFSVQAFGPLPLVSFKQAGVTDVKVIGACGLQY